MRPAGAPAGKVYVVGAGLAGLSAAVSLASRGAAVTLIEASAQAGGRCRSYFDPVLGMTIDNGNHLVLSGNDATFAYLRAIGAEDRLIGPDEARLDFLDRRDGARWAIRANDGPIPWWLASPFRRVAGTKLPDYLSLLPLLSPRSGRTVGEVLSCEGVLWDRLLGPFLLAALNTDPAEASATIAGAVIRRSLARGGRAYQPRIAHPTLAAAFVEPASKWLRERGVEIQFGRPVRSLGFDRWRVTSLLSAEDEIAVQPGDSVVVAVPPWIARDLVPGLIAPERFNAIVNAHFALAPPPGAAPIVGVIGGTAEWVFAFPDRLSVTVSAADALANDDREDLAARLWADVAAVHALAGPPPPSRIIKERRATFAATPEENRKRPPATTAWRNLFLAGDWTATGLPATIEGAISSGVVAADQVRRHRGDMLG
ncbi:MAG: hydroxysqualene dehydroxylase HpnE [Caulobacteraceae bacterium]